MAGAPERLSWSRTTLPARMAGTGTASHVPTSEEAARELSGQEKDAPTVITDGRRPRRPPGARPQSGTRSRRWPRPPASKKSWFSHHLTGLVEELGARANELDSEEVTTTELANSFCPAPCWSKSSTTSWPTTSRSSPGPPGPRTAAPCPSPATTRTKAGASNRSPAPTPASASPTPMCRPSTCSSPPPRRSRPPSCAPSWRQPNASRWPEAPEGKGVTSRSGTSGGWRGECRPL